MKCPLHKHLFALYCREFGEKTYMAAFHFVATTLHRGVFHCFDIFFVVQSSQFHAFYLLGKSGVPHAVGFERVAELAAEIYRVANISVAVTPAAIGRSATHPALDGGAAGNFHILLGGSAAYATSQIDANARSVVGWECESYHS